MKLALVAALALAAPVLAGKPVPNRPYVQSGPDGAFYARCVPGGDTGSAGSTKVLQVGNDKDDLLDTYPWYAPEGVTLGWSPVAGKVAVMARGPGLSFHLGGKELASYTVEGLGKLGVEVRPERGPNGPVARAAFKVVGCEQVPGTNEYDFVIESGTVRLRFDILTGKPRAAVWAAISVSRPLVREGDEPVVVHLAWGNEGKAPVFPRIEASKLLVNGAEVSLSGIGMGPRDVRWDSLPPNEFLTRTWALGDAVAKPGVYNRPSRNRASQPLWWGLPSRHGHRTDALPE